MGEFEVIEDKNRNKWLKIETKGNEYTTYFMEDDTGTFDTQKIKIRMEFFKLDSIYRIEKLEDNKIAIYFIDGKSMCMASDRWDFDELYNIIFPK